MDVLLTVWLRCTQSYDNAGHFIWYESMDNTSDLFKPSSHLKENRYSTKSGAVSLEN